MAKKKVSGKAVSSAKNKLKKAQMTKVSQDQPVTAKHDKKQIMMHGIGLHLVVYLMISILLYLMGAPATVSLIVFMVLFWGLFVMSYAYYYHK